MMSSEAKTLLQENEARKHVYFREYDRTIGDPQSFVIPRFEVKIGGKSFYLPKQMIDLPVVQGLIKYGSWRAMLDALRESEGKPPIDDAIIVDYIIEFSELRSKYDFEFWAFNYVKIQDKNSKKRIPFKLNYGQRKLLSKFEELRLSGTPIRVIVVKARQWGGSTLTQMYMLWLQLFHYDNWHSAIISQYKTQANNIRNMITKTMNTYPEIENKPSLTPLPNTPNIRVIEGRGCEIQVTSAETPDAVRSFDLSMVHMSEVAFWAETKLKSGNDLVQAVYSSIPDEPGTLIVMESTAKGVGSFFHEQWLAAESGESDMSPIFVPWHEIDRYVRPIFDYDSFIKTLSEYNLWQWRQGATLEGINWYNWYKKVKRYSDFQMKSEYPTTATEAFQTNAGKYFSESVIRYAQETCEKPEFIGDIRGDSLVGRDSLKNIEFIENDTGGSELLKIWTKPQIFTDKKVTNRYLVVVDIGGRTFRADNSIIAVYDRFWLMEPFGALEKVAEWAGHIDHDILAWKAAQIATYYDNALLVIESNTIDSKDKKKGDNILYEGDHTFTVIDEISEEYENLYARGAPQDKAIDTGAKLKYGWNTNKKTKYLAFDYYTAKLRDREYIERSQEAVYEMDYFEIKSDGTIGAVIGKRDDRLICNAVGTYVAYEEMELPKIIIVKNDSKQTIRQKKNIGAAGF